MNFLKRVLSSKIARWVFAFLLLISLFLVIRSCRSGGVPASSVYYIARPENWYPIQLSGKEANLQAFINELISKIGEDEKLAINMDTYRTENLFRMLDRREHDAILKTVGSDPFLREKYLVSEAIFLAGPVLVVPANSKVTSLAELKGRSIGVSKESPLIFSLASQYPDLQLVSYDNAITALNELDARSVSGVIIEAQLAYTYTEVLYPGRFKVATPQLVDLGIRLITHKGKREEDLIEKFNRGLAKLKESGEYDLLLDRWEIISSK